MSCEPIRRPVEVPCIERNCMGAVKAVRAASLAGLGDSQHFVQFDPVIATMNQTSRDMDVRCRETSLVGLRVSQPGC